MTLPIIECYVWNGIRSLPDFFFFFRFSEGNKSDSAKRHFAFAPASILFNALFFSLFIWTVCNTRAVDSSVKYLWQIQFIIKFYINDCILGYKRCIIACLIEMVTEAFQNLGLQKHKMTHTPKILNPQVLQLNSGNLQFSWFFWRHLFLWEEILGNIQRDCPTVQQHKQPLASMTIAMFAYVWWQIYLKCTLKSGNFANLPVKDLTLEEKVNIVKKWSTSKNIPVISQWRAVCTWHKEHVPRFRNDLFKLSKVLG